MKKRDFEKLQRKWYAKIERAGFRDIERRGKGKDSYPISPGTMTYQHCEVSLDANWECETGNEAPFENENCEAHGAPTSVFEMSTARHFRAIEHLANSLPARSLERRVLSAFAECGMIRETAKRCKMTTYAAGKIIRDAMAKHKAKGAL